MRFKDVGQDKKKTVRKKSLYLSRIPICSDMRIVTQAIIFYSNSIVVKFLCRFKKFLFILPNKHPKLRKLMNNQLCSIKARML